MQYAPTQWIYDHREAVSWGMACTLALVLGVMTMASPMPERQRVEALMAHLEQVSVPPEPLPRPVARAPQRPQAPAQTQQRMPAPVATEAREPTLDAPPSMQAPAAVPVHPIAPSAAPGTPTSQPVQPQSLSAAERPSAASSHYAAALVAYLERIKRYPTSREARLTRPQGLVQVWLEIDRQGRLLGAGIAASSGSNLLDAQALATLRSGQYPPFPDDAYAGAPSHRFVARLKYAIEND